MKAIRGDIFPQLHLAASNVKIAADLLWGCTPPLPMAAIVTPYKNAKSAALGGGE